MATESASKTSSKTAPTGEVPDFAQAAREQLLTAVQQTQQLSLDATREWVKAASAFAVPALSPLPGLPETASVQAVSKFGFDVAADLLSAQRDYTAKLADVLVSAQSA